MEGLTLLCHIPIQSPRVCFGAPNGDEGAAGSGSVVTAALGVTLCSRFPSSGSMNQFTAIYNGSGELINNIKYYDGFMGQRVGAISCLAFHPHWVCIHSVWVRDLHFLVNVGSGRGKGTGTRCCPSLAPRGCFEPDSQPGSSGLLLPVVPDSRAVGATGAPGLQFAPSSRTGLLAAEPCVLADQLDPRLPSAPTAPGPQPG